MRYVTFAGRSVSAIGLGTWQFGSSGWGWGRGFNKPEATAIVKRALELGVTLFDTAEIYGGGESERVLGSALNGHRGDVYVATKLWPLHAMRPQVLPALRASLDRLSTESVELYQLHWRNPAVPLRWTMGGMREAVKQGLADQIGVSNFSLARWKKADSALGAPVVSNQVPYNLLQRGPEWDVIPFARDNDRLVIAYSPLAQGLLSGRFGTHNLPGGYRKLNRFFLPDNVLRVMPVLDVLREVASAHHASMSQIALAWTIRGSNVAAIPGATGVWQLEENAAAADIELKDDEVAALNAASRVFHPVERRARVRDFAKRLVLR